jgi:hypothetical protein
MEELAWRVLQQIMSDISPRQSLMSPRSKKKIDGKWMADRRWLWKDID